MEATDSALLAAIFIISAAFLRHFFNRRCSNPPLPPGPRRLPIIGHLHLLSPKLHHNFHEFSLKYGPLVQLYLGSMPCVVASSPEVVREFLKTNEVAFLSRQQSTAIDIVTYQSSFSFSPYGPYWKYIKKVCTQELLGMRNLAHFQPIRIFEVKSFLKILHEKGESGEVINITEELLKLTSNVISNMMLSIRCSSTDTEAQVARTVVREVTQIFGEFHVADIIWFCKNFDFQGVRKRSQDIHRRYDGLLEKIISEREKQRRSRPSTVATEPADILDLLLDILENENAEVKFTRVHVKALILDFFTAGTDTTAILAEWAMAELMSNPNALSKAQEEIDRIIGSDRLVQETDGPALPYLQAIIKETFRLHPPIPMISRKSSTDCVVDSYHIPSQTVLFVNVWSMGRNPKYWENPTVFKPERFLEKDKEHLDIRGQHYELLPFGTGRRGCPGMVLAINELVSIIGAMIQCFNWRLPDGVAAIDMAERPGLSAPRANDLLCHVAPRIETAVDLSP